MRIIYIVDPTQAITNGVRAAAQTAGATEIAQGIPPRLVRDGVIGTYPFVYEEPDDPDKVPLQQAITVLRNQFQQSQSGTPRTAAQLNNFADAMTILMRKVVGELRD
jgi:hypothetical protein